jgi:hypothetical protein
MVLILIHILFRKFQIGLKNIQFLLELQMQENLCQYVQISKKKQIIPSFALPKFGH